MSPWSCFLAIFRSRLDSKGQKKSETPRNSKVITRDDDDGRNPFQQLSELAAPEPVQNRDEGGIERHDFLERHLSNV